MIVDIQVVELVATVQFVATIVYLLSRLVGAFLGRH